MSVLNQKMDEQMPYFKRSSTGMGTDTSFGSNVEWGAVGVSHMQLEQGVSSGGWRVAGARGQ